MALGLSASNLREEARNLSNIIGVGFTKYTKYSCYYDIRTHIFSLQFYNQINVKVSHSYNRASITYIL